MNVQNGLLKIYECGKKFQLMYKRACSASDQTFEFIQDIISQCTSNPEFFRFIHKYIQDFDDVRKYHLDPNDMYLNGVNSTDEDVIERMEESKSSNGDDENKNCNRKASDNNKSAEENASEQKENARETRANKLKCVRPIKQAQLTPTIHHNYSIGLVKIPLLLNI